MSCMPSNSLKRQSRRGNAKRRRGAMMILIAFVMTAIVAVTALAINTCYLELARTELRLSVDACAKAGIVELGETQDDLKATARAREIGALNTVAGKPFVMLDILKGTYTKTSSGGHEFIPFNDSRFNGTVNALYVTGPDIRTGAGKGTRTTLMSNIRFGMFMTSCAIRSDHDVSLVLDRSGSMAWDLSNKEYSYPNDASGPRSRLQAYFSPPHASESRWSAVRGAVDTFRRVLSRTPDNIRVGMVSYSSDYTFGACVSTQVSTDLGMTKNLGQLLGKMDSIGTKPIIGDTNIAAGLQAAIDQVSDGRVTATKTIILFSDGMKTEGGDPVALAKIARERNIVTHTIAFSSQADQNLMREVAKEGGGKYVFASSASELDDAFRQIAECIPSMLIHGLD
jgi:Ca-activated chloride channel homolog